MNHFERVIHAFLPDRLDDCDPPHADVKQASAARLQLLAFYLEPSSMNALLWLWPHFTDFLSILELILRFHRLLSRWTGWRSDPKNLLQFHLKTFCSRMEVVAELRRLTRTYKDKRPPKKYVSKQKQYLFLT